jgi:hypothetical protein
MPRLGCASVLESITSAVYAPYSARAGHCISGCRGHQFRLDLGRHGQPLGSWRLIRSHRWQAANFDNRLFVRGRGRMPAARLH